MFTVLPDALHVLTILTPLVKTQFWIFTNVHLPDVATHSLLTVLCTQLRWEDFFKEAPLAILVRANTAVSERERASKQNYI